MAIFVCSQCSHTETTSDDLVGRKARCLNCDTMGTIQAHATPAEPVFESTPVPSTQTPPAPPPRPATTAAAGNTPDAAEKSQPADKPARDSQRLMVLVVLVSLLLGIQSINLILNSAVSQRWEYDIVSPDDSEVVEELNLLGAQGWDIVTARRAIGYNNKSSYEMLIRRAR